MSRAWARLKGNKKWRDPRKKNERRRDDGTTEAPQRSDRNNLRVAGEGPGMEDRLSADKTEFILTCKRKVEYGRVTVNPHYGIARDQVTGIIQRHGREHGHE
jgi:hypothetical protein